MNSMRFGTGIESALVEALLDPVRLRSLDAAGWSRMLACARRNAVLAYLGERAVRTGVIDALPTTQRDALLSARTGAARLGQLARWELDRVTRVLRPLDIPIIALKGVAYILHGCRTPVRASCPTST